MTRWEQATDLTVLCCRDPASPEAAPAVAALRDADALHEVAALPGREIDGLLQTAASGRVLVIGTDAALAAVVVRLLRKELLETRELAYAPVGPSVVAHRYSLPSGPRAVELARLGDPDLVPLVRDDAGGVLIGEASLGPLDGTVYVDEHRLLGGKRAKGVVVEPQAPQGLQVTLVFRSFGLIGRKAVVRTGRAVQIGTRPAVLVADGFSRSKPVERWTYYAHTAPLRLVRGVVD